MPQNFLECDREQAFLMPPDPRDWLPEGHLAWFVLASVEELDLAAFYASYRVDGWGRAAFEPGMMVSLLLYAYARGERSSRGIERGCVEDVAYRVIAAQQAPLITRRSRGSGSGMRSRWRTCSRRCCRCVRRRGWWRSG
jgi:transposase